MSVRRSILLLAAVLLALTASSSMGIYVSNCPQICTPTCPCSLQCQGPFGPTTCGAAGQACTGFAPIADTNTDSLFFFPALLTTDVASTVAVDVEVEADENVEPVESTDDEQETTTADDE